MTGYTDAELLGTSYHGLVVPKDYRKVARHYKALLHGPGEPRRYETTLITKEGIKLPVLVSARRTIYDGKPAIIRVFTDITEQKRVQEELKVAKGLVEEVVQGAFHDILGPLGTAKSFTEMAKEESPDDEISDYAFSSMKKAVEILEDYRVLFNMYRGVPPKLEEIDLGDVARAAFAGYAHQFAEKGKTLINTVKGSYPTHAHPLVRQVFDNYLANALKYTVPHTTTMIAAKKNGQSIRVDVIDEGPMIPKSKRDLVFAFNYRLASDQEGSGIGLANVKKIADALDAKVGVEPYGKGKKTFYLIMRSLT